MKYYLIIDPALPQAYLKLSNDVKNVDDSLSAPAQNLWTSLDQLIKNTNQELSNLVFFINFGPGSYTGLKQSKILAEVFKGAGAQVYIYHQNHVLNASQSSYRYFFSSAYKGQYYLSEKNTSVNATSRLMETPEWQQWFLEHQTEKTKMITIDAKFAQAEGCANLVDVYNHLTYENLLEFSEIYNDQPITYYRAVSDDYQISFTR